MPRLSAARREPGIEITPLIDVVFLLLIFFMVSSNFVQKQVIAVSLPEAESAVADVSGALQITIEASGEYWIDGQRVGQQRQALALAVRQFAEQLQSQSRDQQPVEIRADANATHQSVVHALDICAEVGFVQVSLATLMPSQSTPTRSQE